MLSRWIWLAQCKGVSSREKIALLEHFHDIESVYAADGDALRETVLLSEDAVQALEDKSLENAEAVLESCRRKDVKLLTYLDSRYPKRLKNISDPPVLLYYYGQLADFDATAVIGVVGTRKASAYGLTNARKLAGDICRCGGIVVSGMAAGIDGAATEGALLAGDYAVGVLGCGIDQVYPASNRPLFRRVRERGCLISEYPPGTPGARWTFPERNRIISGLSCGVLVVEAPEKSGALITARQALEQGRDVFVVPGNIGVASCAGSNGLLREGAIMASSGWDVVQEYTSLFPDKLHEPGITQTHDPVQVAQTPVFPTGDKISVDNRTPSPYSGVDPALSPAEQTLAALLAAGEMHTDELMAQSGLAFHAAMSALTMLQIKGMIMTLPGGRVKRIR